MWGGIYHWGQSRFQYHLGPWMKRRRLLRMLCPSIAERGCEKFRILYASQTGTAQMFAMQPADALIADLEGDSEYTPISNSSRGELDRSILRLAALALLEFTNQFVAKNHSVGAGLVGSSRSDLLVSRFQPKPSSAGTRNQRFPRAKNNPPQPSPAASRLAHVRSCRSRTTPIKSRSAVVSRIDRVLAENGGPHARTHALSRAIKSVAVRTDFLRPEMAPAHAQPRNSADGGGAACGGNNTTRNGRFDRPSAKRPFFRPFFAVEDPRCAPMVVLVPEMRHVDSRPTNTAP